MSTNEILQAMDELAIEVFLLLDGKEKEPGARQEVYEMAVNNIIQAVKYIGGDTAAKNHVNAVMACFQKIAEQKGWDL